MATLDNIAGPSPTTEERRIHWSLYLMGLGALTSLATMVAMAAGVVFTQKARILHTSAYLALNLISVYYIYAFSNEPARIIVAPPQQNADPEADHQAELRAVTAELQAERAKVVQLSQRIAELTRDTDEFEVI